MRHILNMIHILFPLIISTSFQKPILLEIWISKKMSKESHSPKLKHLKSVDLKDIYAKKYMSICL